MLFKVFCACLDGLEIHSIIIEVVVSDGIQFFLVGLPDSAVKESQQRIGGALASCGYRLPGKRIVVNMAPANIRKEGSSFDVGIGIGILAASAQISVTQDVLNRFFILGELALDGSIREIQGALPIAMRAIEEGFQALILPFESALECVEFEDIDIYAVRVLPEVVAILTNPCAASHLLVRNCAKSKLSGFSTTAKEMANNGKECAAAEDEYDFSMIKGQLQARRALEIAAGGGHNLIMNGSPGSGKTFMAKCLKTILPPLSKEEAMQTSVIYSVAGLLGGIANGGLLKQRPFRAPHHTITVAALVGGGSKGLPGEISLAHNGVLFLDEFGEFERKALEVLRQPMEDGVIHISRVRARYTYPANFMLVAAMNPCPCGKFYDSMNDCTCTPYAISRYRAKVSGPLFDRIDIQLKISTLTSSEIIGKSGTDSAIAEAQTPQTAEPSRVIAKRVAVARQIQKLRFTNEGVFTNARMNNRLIKKYCSLSEECEAIMNHLVDKMGFSYRAYTRILKIARTIADMEIAKTIAEADIPLNASLSVLEQTIKERFGLSFELSANHILEAAKYRFMDREQ